MKKFLSSFAISCLLITSLGVSNVLAYDDWVQVNTDAFGDPGPTFGSEDFFVMTSYDGCLVAGIEATSGTEGSRLYRSCDGTTWTQFNTDGFGDPPEHDHIDSVVGFGGYLYASNAVQNDTFNGTKTYRTNNWGTTWEPIITDGFGTPQNENYKGLIVFNNQICGGTWNGTSGTQLYCSSDGTTFSQVNTNGFDNTDNFIVWESAEYNGSVYFPTTNTATGSEVWRSPDLSNWYKVVDNGAGSGSAENTLSGLVIFEDQLLVFNNATSDLVVVRINPDDTWENISTINSVGRPTSESTTVLNGYLHVPTFNSTTGVEIWRTHDLINWEQMNTDGFGDSGNRYAVLHTFGSYIYAGTGNYVTGQEVWRFKYNTDAAISITPTQASVTTGADESTVTFDVLVENVGEDPYGNPTVTISYGSELENPEIGDLPSGWTCDIDEIAREIICNSVNIINAESNESFQIHFTTVAQNVTTHINATIGNDTQDLNTADNTSAAEVELIYSSLADTGDSLYQSITLGLILLLVIAKRTYTRFLNS